MKWQPFPMIRIAAFFTGGVLFGIYQADFLSLSWILAIGGAAAILLLLIRFFGTENKWSVYAGIVGLFLVFFLGYARSLLYDNSRSENHISKVSEPIAAYEAIVRSAPEGRGRYWKTEMEVTRLKTAQWQAATGRLLLYVSKNDERLGWHYGDKILVRGTPQELAPPLNPFEFDFKRFLHFRNISHQQFTSMSDVKRIEETSSKGLIYYSHEARTWCRQRLHQFIEGDDEQGIATALVLGVTDGIDNDLRNAYAASGAMHVLAVSGMHIGIIYAIVLFLFKPFDKFKTSKWVVAVVSLICLWSFSFVTGNSPSVLRAVTMFSFIALARPFGKRTNIYNTLAASILVLLIYNPYLILSVGFQLSYLAVLGIVYLYRPLYQLWAIENRVGDWIWGLTCVSIAAQLATFAIGLLYFHQFPTYFLISNMIVVPLSTFVLLGGILLLAVSFFSPLAAFVGTVLEWLIKALNWTVFRTEALPWSLVNHIQLTGFQCALLIGILITLVLLVQFKSSKWLYTSFALTLIFSVSQWWHFETAIKQRQWIVYGVNNQQAFEFLDNGRSFFVSDSSLQRDPQQIQFHIDPNRLQHGVALVEPHVPFVVEKNGMRFYQWRGKTIAFLSEKKPVPPNARVDVLVVGRNALQSEQIPTLNIKQVIFDGTNTRMYIEKTSQLAGLNRIQVHSVLKDGAFIIQ